ncbi:MAG: radical SAM protein [Desulfobacteraceae bacterium]|nr:radical SAM protein [Desulfobacteraceae bacterium]
MKFDMKSYLRFANSGVLNFLRISPRMSILPSIVIYPTDACNYDCIMCSGGRSNKTPRLTMDISMLERVINECAEMMIKPRLHFSGLGEPLVYPNVVEMMELCNQKSLRWTMTTNGLGLKKHTKNLVDNRCSALNLSIHGTKHEHDKITGTAGSFEIVIDGLQAIVEEKIRQDKGRPLIALNCVINNQNSLRLMEILETFSSLPVNSITFQHLVFSTYEMDAHKPHLITDEKKLNAIVDFIDYVKNNKLPVRCNFFPRIRKEDVSGYYINKNYQFNNTCILPWLSVRILPNGDVKMCNEFYGSLENDSLKTIVNSDKAKGFRDRVRKGEFESFLCFRCCHRQYY